MKLQSLILIIPFFFSCQSNEEKSEIVEDKTISAQPANNNELLNDTILKEIDSAKAYFHYVYIDRQSPNEELEKIMNFEFSDWEHEVYRNSFNSISKEIKNVRIDLEEIENMNMWNKLYSHNDKYYVYAPSDWGSNYRIKITDSCLVEYYMDGPNINLYKSPVKISDKKFEMEIFGFRSMELNERGEKWTFYLIDEKKGIAVLKRGVNDYCLLVNSMYLKDYPVIVNECKTQKVREYSFDQIDYESLIKNGTTGL